MRGGGEIRREGATIRGRPRKAGRSGRRSAAGAPLCCRGVVQGGVMREAGCGAGAVASGRCGDARHRGCSCPGWIRTTTNGSKGRCPAIRRPGKKSVRIDEDRGRAGPRGSSRQRAAPARGPSGRDLLVRPLRNAPFHTRRSEHTPPRAQGQGDSEHDPPRQRRVHGTLSMLPWTKGGRGIICACRNNKRKG